MSKRTYYGGQPQWVGSYTSRRRHAIRFFADHAGYCTPPGRMVCAKALADAEEWIREEEDYDYQWTLEVMGTTTDDSLGDHTYWCRAARKDECSGHYIYSVTLCINGEVVASLGGIIDPDRNYRRVIEAELAQEAHDNNE